jgi:2-polyprenyl-3-methyl-5-hydroxy-6-metoxy-1,4-benzoquinol methylase
MLDLHYSNQKLADLYDLDSPWSAERDFYLDLAPPSPIDILDLGCGTGLLCNAYAELGHRVTGVDPAQPMLNVAQKKRNGSKIDWVCATAQTFNSRQRFDLIIMTGHVFQVLLTDDEVTGTLETMAKYLKPHGRIVFESRNPNLDWGEIWHQHINGKSEDQDAKNSRHFSIVSADKEFIKFEMQYRMADETLVSKSKLRFMSQAAIENSIEGAGLHVETILGDWDGAQFDPRLSHEMIFFAGHVKKTKRRESFLSRL